MLQWVSGMTYCSKQEENKKLIEHGIQHPRCSSVMCYFYPNFLRLNCVQNLRINCVYIQGNLGVYARLLLLPGGDESSTSIRPRWGFRKDWLDPAEFLRGLASRSLESPANHSVSPVVSSFVPAPWERNQCAPRRHYCYKRDRDGNRRTLYPGYRWKYPTECPSSVVWGSRWTLYPYPDCWWTSPKPMEGVMIGVDTTKKKRNKLPCCIMRVEGGFPVASLYSQ